ncbi:MAG: 50S ribosomal protein L5 [Clostridiales bacterium]|jgi:large subunit ribosomal protein L5|nr:50S ribosomal protein L5 [Clostridiales bacterium]
MDDKKNEKKQDKPAAKDGGKAKAAKDGGKIKAEKSGPVVKSDRKPRLKLTYAAEVLPALVKKFNFRNVNEAPGLEKIVLNMRLGDIKDNTKSMNLAVEELRIISGQKPVMTKAKHSLSNWKIREGMPIGTKVTLRGDRMYDFFDKLVNVGLPRVRDFKGVPGKSFDGRGNYSLGIKEQLIFPEITYDQVEKVRGFDICITTSALTDEHAKELLRLLGMPFKN